MSPTEKLIHNERIKLRANAFNTLGTAYFTIGVIAPIASCAYHVSPHAAPWYLNVLCAAVFAYGGWRFHRLGQNALGGLVG